MLDDPIRRRIDPALDKIARILTRLGVSADAVSLCGFALALAAAGALTYREYFWGFALVCISRLCDGLDGAVARQSRKTDFGGFLDIVLDFAFYGLIPLAFIFADPGQNAIAGGVLLLSFYVNGASFLTYALMAEKRGLEEGERGKKSFLYSVGLMEAGETFVLFALFCFFPDHFPVLAFGGAALVFYTTLARFALAKRNFK